MIIFVCLENWRRGDARPVGADPAALIPNLSISRNSRLLHPPDMGVECTSGWIAPPCQCDFLEPRGRTGALVTSGMECLPMKIKSPAKEYVEKAKSLSRKDAERLFSRMGGKLARRLDDNKLSALELVAIQLELEDQQLQEWRQNFAALKKKFKD
jgi:hypothetical protein